MTCPRCANQNSPDAAHCSQCGQPLSVSSTAPAASLLTDMALWRKFIGPRADYYLERFRLFREGERERVAPTWHWPALGIGLTAVAIAAGIMEAPVPVRPPSSGAPA